MPFLTPEEINTHLYGEVVTEITRDSAAAIDKAITAAVAEAYGYLTQYDVDAIFAATADDRNPILVLYVKDMAVWHFIQLSNPGVDMELRKNRYEWAIDWFEKVQAGKTNPKLPIPTVPVDEVSGSVENFVKWGGNPRRGNYY